MARLTAKETKDMIHPLSMNHSSQHPLEERGVNSSIRSAVSTRSADESTVSARNPAAVTANHASGEEATTDRSHQQQPHRSDPSMQAHHPSFAARHEFMADLPRSVRWRLSLGLLTNPLEDSVGTNDNTGRANCMQQILALQQIEQVNALKLRFQRSRYEDLEKRHYWNSSATGIARGGQTSPVEAKEKKEGLQQVARGEDPLSSALIETEEKEKGSFFGLGKKRQLKNKMGSASSNGRHPTKDEAQPNPLNTQKSSFAKREEEDKWADFYSTREILDVIEKDLNRLPTDHYTVYHSKRMRDRVRKGESEHRGSGGSASSARGDDSEDTAPTRQNNARRRKRLGSNFAQSLQLGLNPNFARLNSIEDEEDDRKKAELMEKAEIETSTKERAEKLSRLLFVYAKEHECIGYRQGMHEILSYILLVLEMDLTEYSLGAERRKWRDASNGGSEPGGMAGVDSSGNIVVVRLLDEKYAMHDAFTLFECVMEALTASYDVEMGDRESISSDNIQRGCLEAMTNSIVSKIRYVARDEALFGHVLYMPVPPQLYFAKWVRLMFCREVAGGIEAVMKLWDAFFELAAATASMDEDVDISKALINVLKTAAASMILLIRHLLLAPTVAWDGSLTGDPDPNDGISFLMNYPPIEDIGVLVKTITSLLAKEKMMAAKAARQDGREQIVTEKRRHSLTSYDPIVAIKKQPDQQEEDTMSRSSSRGDFMGWPSREKLEAQNNDAPVIIPSAGDLKMMRSSIISSANSVEEDSDADENEPSETFGEFAAGMWNKSTQDLKESFKRTMSFTGIKFLEEDIQHHNIENGSRGQSTNEDNFSAELLEQSDRLLGESDRDDDPTLIEVIHTELSDSNTKGKVPRRRQHSLSVDSLNNDDLCQSSLPGSNDGDNVSVYSHSSRLSTMSVSKSLSETCRKDPKELAAKLEKSVASLMKHFNDQICAHADTNGVRPNNQHQPIMIPEDIWDAMADIDQVRKDLMAQCATEQLDKAPSSASLYGLKFKALQYSMEHDKELCDSVKDADKVVHR